MHVKPASLISDERISYRSLFLLFAAVIFLVKGQVNSTRRTVDGVVFLLMITISGFCEVTIISGGTSLVSLG